MNSFDEIPSPEMDAQALLDRFAGADINEIQDSGAERSTTDEFTGAMEAPPVPTALSEEFKVPMSFQSNEEENQPIPNFQVDDSPDLGPTDAPTMEGLQMEMGLARVQSLQVNDDEEVQRAVSTGSFTQSETNRLRSNSSAHQTLPETVNEEYSPPVAREDGLEYTNQDIDEIAEMLLNPRKTQGELISNSSSAMKLSRGVREALKQIVSSPSPRASATAQLFKNQGGRIPQPESPGFATQRSMLTHIRRYDIIGGTTAADRAALETAHEISRVALFQKALHTPREILGATKQPDSPSFMSPGSPGDSRGSRQHANFPPPKTTEWEPAPPRKLSLIVDGLQATTSTGSAHQSDITGLQESSVNMSNVSEEQATFVAGLQDESATRLESSPEALQIPNFSANPISPKSLQSATSDHDEGANGSDEFESPATEETLPAESSTQPFNKIVVPQSTVGVRRAPITGLENADLVEKVLDILDRVMEHVTELNVSTPFESPSTLKESHAALAAEVVSLRSAQLAVIQDDPRNALGSLRDVKNKFNERKFVECDPELDQAEADMRQLLQHLLREKEFLEGATNDEKHMFYNNKGNDAMQKAGFGLSFGRFDHALAFIAQAKVAFTNTGNQEKLDFLQDMNRRVVLEATRKKSPIAESISDKPAHQKESHSSTSTHLTFQSDSVTDVETVSYQSSLTQLAPNENLQVVPEIAEQVTEVHQPPRQQHWLNAAHPTVQSGPNPTESTQAGAYADLPEQVQGMPSASTIVHKDGEMDLMRNHELDLRRGISSCYSDFDGEGYSIARIPSSVNITPTSSYAGLSQANLQHKMLTDEVEGADNVAIAEQSPLNSSLASEGVPFNLQTMETAYGGLVGAASVQLASLQ